MPLYEYQCDSCGARFERIQKFSDAPVSECPTCGSGVRKLISSPAIQFKGSGWYITDYAKGNSSPASAGKTGASAESGSSSTGSGGSNNSGGDSKDAGSKDSGSKDSGSTTEKAGAPAAGPKPSSDAKT